MSVSGLARAIAPGMFPQLQFVLLTRLIILFFM